LREDIEAGYQYDGELASVLARLPQPFWRENVEFTRDFVSLLKRGVAEVDDDVKKEAETFLELNE
jgi:hypothetical protein